MASFNRISLIGNVGRDPEVRDYQGTKVASFSLAVNERTKKADGQVEEKTMWFKITFWRNLAEIAEKYVKKGTQIYVDGKLSASTYVDKNQQTQISLEVRGENLTLLSGVQGNESATTASSSNTTAKVADNDSSFTQSEQGDDLPF
jgi:single-strand DNA-binding protein